MNEKEKEINININLQKTISGLISSVISSICQQFFCYERSVDIYGLLSVNIDDNFEVSVKINERFTKSETTSNLINFDCLKLIETIKKNVEKENSDEIIANKIKTTEVIEETKIISNSNEIGPLKSKRKPRKPHQTYRYLVNDIHKDQDLSNLSSNDFIENLEDPKFKTENEAKVKEDHVDLIPSNVNDQKCEDSFKTGLEFEKIHNYHKKPLKASSTITDEEVNESKPEKLFKCTLCDQQFKKRLCLARHKRTHQNYKSYKCNVCGLGFELINQLKRHLRNVHMYSLDNLRNYSVKHQKVETNINQMSNNFTSQNYSWPNLSTLPIFSSCLPITSALIDSQPILPNYVLPYSYSPGLVSQSNNTPILNTFISSTSVSGHYQNSQVFTPLLPGSESIYPYNNPLYYLQHYSPILPSSCLYPSLLKNPNITPVNNNFSNTFNQGHVYSPSLESMPLMSRHSSSKEDSSVEGFVNLVS